MAEVGLVRFARLGMGTLRLRVPPGDPSIARTPASGEGRKALDEAEVAYPVLVKLAGRSSAWLRAVMVPRPPSLVVFTPLVVTITLFACLVTGLTSARVSGDLSAGLQGPLLLSVS